MSSRAKVTAAVEALGGTMYESNGRNLDGTLEAPSGSVWASTLTHWIVFTGPPGTPAREIWADALEDVRPGVVPCSEVDCETCEG